MFFDGGHVVGDTRLGRLQSVDDARIDAAPLARLGQGSRIEELESLRGLAALLVVLYHIPKWNPILDTGVINNGYLMVEVFFVLSGFVMSTAYGSKIHSATDLLRFQFLRLGRLYPVHAFFLLLFVGIELAKYIAVARMGAHSIRTVPFAENSAGALVEQIFLWQGIGPTGHSLSFNGPAWSISVEFYTYLVFAATLLYAPKKRNRVFAALALASTLLLIAQQTFGFTDLLRCLAGFFVGSLTAEVVQRTKLGVPSFSSLLFLAAMVAFLQLKKIGQLDVLIYALTSLLIMSLMMSRQGPLNKVLRHPCLTWLGLISYSVYMCHFLVLLIVADVFKRVLHRPEVQGVHGKWLLSLSASETLAAAALTALLVLLVAQTTYSLIEKPFREASRQWAFSRLR